MGQVREFLEQLGSMLLGDFNTRSEFASNWPEYSPAANGEWQRAKVTKG